MSLLRVTLVAVQALCNHMACTPPNPTPSKARYHTEELYILQIAPFIFKLHQMSLWICCFFEVLVYLATFPLVASVWPFPTAPFCAASQSNVRTTPLFITGVIAVVVGTWIRVDCFRTLGELFTFDLTVLPNHKLVTTRLYAYVRHPAYTGSLLLIAGLALSHMSPGSWLTECGPLRSSWSGSVVGAVWWLWTLAVGLSRVEAEDRQMRTLFPQEWDKYAAGVPWWFLPGLI